MKVGVRASGLVFVTIVLATACGTSTSTPGGAPPPAPAATPGAGQVAEALRFTATTIDGQQFTGESLAGKPAVLWFWAAWCAICRRESAGVAEVARAIAGTVTFLGVAALSDVPAMRTFVADTGLGSFTHLADTKASVWQRFGVTAQPAYAFIRPNGTVETVKGSLTEDELATHVRQLAG